MRVNLVGAFIRNAPFGTEIAFQKGFQRLGVPVTVIDSDYSDQRFDPDADATVVFKWLEGPYLEQLKGIGGLKIVYQPDDLRFPHIRDMMIRMMENFTFAFTFDCDGADFARGIGFKGARRLLLTADDELYRPLDVTKDVDFCFVGSLTGGPNHASRARMLNVLRSLNKYNVVWASDLYEIPKIVELYNRSKVVLNHATDVGQPFGTGYGYQCRHFEAGFTGACVLSNRVANDDALTYFSQFGDERELLESADFLMETGRWKLMGAKFLEELNRGHRPEHRAAEMITCIKEWSSQCA